MKIRKWVELSKEVEVEITAEDIRKALIESCEMATRSGTGTLTGPSILELLMTLNTVAMFFNAIPDHQIDLMNFGQMLSIESFLRKAADRFKIPREME